MFNIALTEREKQLLWNILDLNQQGFDPDETNPDIIETDKLVQKLMNQIEKASE